MAPPANPDNYQTESTINTRAPLHGVPLHLGRALWVLLAIFSLGIFALSVPNQAIALSSNLPMGTGIALMQLGIPASVTVCGMWIS